MGQLEIEMADDLSCLSFVLDGRRLGEIRNPSLLWQCSCNASDGGRSPTQGPCALHRLPDASEISRSFGARTVIWYRGLQVIWDNWRGWPPAMDSFLLVHSLLQAGWPAPGVRRLWDIGAGTGFVGLQLADATTSVKDLVAVESSQSAVSMCKENLEAYGRRGDLEVEAWHASAQGLSQETFMPGDAIVANPPYLPRPPWAQGTEGESAALGTNLLCHLIQLSAAMKVPLALCYSQLSQPEVDRAIGPNKHAAVRILVERKLPLRVALSSSTRTWLANERGLIIEDSDVFQFHHIVRVVSFSW